MLEIYIRIIASLILVHDIDINHYLIKEYILLEIYFLDKYKSKKKKVRIKITKKAYLVDNLKAKILLNIDIIESKKIDLITLRNKIYIDFYDTIIDINLRLKLQDITIKPIIINK